MRGSARFAGVIAQSCFITLFVQASWSPLWVPAGVPQPQTFDAAHRVSERRIELGRAPHVDKALVGLRLVDDSGFGEAAGCGSGEVACSATAVGPL